MIYIPTNRSAEHQKTIEAFRDPYSRKIVDGVTLVASERVGDYPTRICPVKGIAKVRQWIHDQHSGDVLAMFDDDMVFRRGQPGGCPALSLPDLLEACEIMRAKLTSEGYAHYGFGERYRGGLLGWPESRDSVAPNRCWFYRKDIVDRAGIRFNVLRFHEDWHVRLSLLEHGYKAGNSYRHLAEETKLLPGGCTPERDETTSVESYQAFQAFHPKFVELREVNSPSHTNRWNTTVGAKVHWVRAYKNGLAQREIRNDESAS